MKLVFGLSEAEQSPEHRVLGSRTTTRNVGPVPLSYFRASVSSGSTGERPLGVAPYSELGRGVHWELAWIPQRATVGGGVQLTVLKLTKQLPSRMQCGSKRRDEAGS